MTSPGSPETKSFITNRYNGENTAVPVDPPLSPYQLKRKKERSARFRRIGLFVLVIAIVVGIIVGICISKGTFSSNKLKPVVYQQESQSESNSNNKRIILPKSTYNYSDFDLDTYCNDASCDKAANEILSSLNTSVNPCDNFYNFACQGWHAQNPRPDYEDEWSVFSKLQTQSLHLVIDILNQPVQSGDVPVLSTAQRYYQKCLLAKTNDFQDKYQEKQDMQFILDRLQSYGGWPILYKNNTWNDRRFDWVKTVVGLKKELGLTRLLEVLSFQSPDGDLAENSVFIVPPSGGSKDLEEDDDELDKAVNTLLTYKDFIVNVSRALLEFKGEYNYDKNYLEIKAFEIILVQIEFIKLKKLSVSGSAGLSGRIEITVEKLQRLLDLYTLFNPDGIDIWQLLNKFYANTGVSIAKTQLVDVFNLKYLVSLSSRVARMKPEALANYLHFEMALGMIELSSIKKFQEYSSTLRKAMDGTTRDVPRERVCAAKVQIKFPFVLGHAYLKRKGVQKSGSQIGSLANDMSVTAGNFSKVHKVFDNIHSEFLHLTLSTPITYINKTFLSVELFLTDFCPGYPSWVLDKTRVQSEYTEISLSENYQNSKSYLEQSIQINRWAANKQLSELSVPFEVGECKWSHFPGTVGAFSRMFTVYVPYGMLQLPFYDSYLPASLNYGRLGAIIGHEIAHGLVGRGWSEFANGTETPLAQCLIDQYNRYKFDDTKDTNLTVDGELTLGENLADNAGLLASYNAYKTSYYLDYSTRELNGLEKYSDDQLFFIGFAQNWCETATEKGLRKSLETDVHSPGQFRVLGALQNSAEFAQTWKCPVGSKMNPRGYYGRNKCTVF